MGLKSMRDLLLMELKDLYSAETQIEKALPKAIEEVESEELQQALSDHLEETHGHVRRLEQIGKILGENMKGEHCPAMEGLLKEVKERIEEADGKVLDAAVISASQRVEHYEIAAYGSARTFAELEGEDEVEELLSQTLEEEKMADEKLNEIALSSVNADAEGASDSEEEDDEEAEPSSTASRRGTQKKSTGNKKGGRRSDSSRIPA